MCSSGRDCVCSVKGQGEQGSACLGILSQQAPTHAMGEVGVPPCLLTSTRAPLPKPRQRWALVFGEQRCGPRACFPCGIG